MAVPIAPIHLTTRLTAKNRPARSDWSGPDTTHDGRAFCVPLSQVLDTMVLVMSASITEWSQLANLAKRVSRADPHPFDSRTVGNHRTMTLQNQAWQSGLVLLDETAEWNENDWPPLEGGWRYRHTSVVLNHPETDLRNDNKRQTVVVMGGWLQDQSTTDSVLVLCLSDPDKQWQEGPPMNKSRQGHGAVVCHGGVYVIGGYNGNSRLDCMECIDVNDLLQLSVTASTTPESHWTTVKCRLSTRRSGCCAVAVHNRYIVVMGGYNDRYLSSVDIIDTSTHAVTAGPSMNVPRAGCDSVVVGHRIFVVGGHGEHGNLDSVEYLDFATPCDNHETKEQTGSSFISFSPTWTTQSELRLSNARSPCAVVAVGSCLVVVGRPSRTVEVLDTHCKRVWNLPGLQEDRWGCSMVTVANQIAVIGGRNDPTSATLPLLDKNTWCFRRLCEQHPNGWRHIWEAMGVRDTHLSPFSSSTSARKRARPNTRQNDKGKDQA